MTQIVMPAKAGIQAELVQLTAGGESDWTPAFAGVTARSAIS